MQPSGHTEEGVCSMHQQKWEKIEWRSRDVPSLGSELLNQNFKRIGSRVRGANFKKLNT